MDPLNNTDTRISRTFQTTSPLLNLILAASILSKLAQGKSQAPWFPYRPIIGYYPQPLLYPVDPLVFRPAQGTPLNQQQIIHIHDTPGYNPDGETYEDNTNKYTQNINNFPPAEEEEEEFIEGSENMKLNDSLLVDLIMNQNISENHFLTTTEDPQEEQYQDELETAGTNLNRRRQRPSEYSEYIDEYQEAPKPKRRTTPSRRRQPSRVNSRIGQYRTTTPEPEYYDDYDYTTVKLIRKNPLLRVTPKRRTTTASYEEEDYLVQLPNRMKTTRINRINRRTTKPAYYDDDDEYEQDYAMIERPQDRTFRQSATTTTTAMTTTTTTEGSTSTTTMQPNTTTTASPNTTHNAYGPPHPGYGPSNGNENISITYGPPVASPFWDSWYNQYSKSSVIRRIQELLTPSNYYSPQQETDDYYNGVF